MKIEVNISDLPDNQKLSRITVDFDNGEPRVSTQTIRKTRKSEDSKDAKESGTAIDFSTLGDLQVSQEVVEKPVIPDKERPVSVASGMQNLVL